MSHLATTRRLAAASLALALAGLAAADSGSGLGTAPRSDDGGAPAAQTGSRADNEIRPGGPRVQVGKRPSWGTGQQASGTNGWSAGRGQGGANPVQVAPASGPELVIDRPRSNGAHNPVQGEARRAGTKAGWQTDRDHGDFLEIELLDELEQLEDDPFGFEVDAPDRSGVDTTALQLAGPVNTWQAEDSRLLHDPMDIDFDGRIDFNDFAMLVAAFGTEDHDLDGNGIVDGGDLGLMLSSMSTALEH